METLYMVALVVGVVLTIFTLFFDEMFSKCASEEMMLLLEE